MRGFQIFCLLLATSVAGAQAPSKAPWQRLPSDAIVARIDRMGHVTVNRQPVAPSSLDTLLHRIYSPRPDKTLYLELASGAPENTRRWLYRLAAGAGVKIIPLPVDRPRTSGARPDERARRSQGNGANST